MGKLLSDIALPAGAMLAALLLFGVLVWFAGVSPLDVWLILFKGAFGDWFSWQNTLQRAAPLMLTALCVAIPARAGLVIIGGEGALVLGGLAGAALPYAMPLPGNLAGTVIVCAAGAAAGGLWIALAGWLRQYRGINETISSLLLAYVAIGLFKHFVEGPLRDPASLNKPSTACPRPKACASAALPARTCTGASCWASWPASALGLWLRWTPGGFAVRVVGGNPRAAQLVGLPATRLILLACAAGRRLRRAWPAPSRWRRCTAAPTPRSSRAMAMPASWCRSWRGTTRWRIIPVAILFGGFGAAGSLLQRRLGLPDASVLVLQGIAFVLILASEALRGKDWGACFANFRSRPRPPADRAGAGRDGGQDLHDAGPVDRRVRRHCRRRPARRRAVPVREPGRMPDRKIRPHQPRPRRRAGAVGACRPSAAPTSPARPGSACCAAALAGALLGAAARPAVLAADGVNDVAIGIALMLLGTGLAFYFGKPLIQPQAPQLPVHRAGRLERLAGRCARRLQVNALLPLGVAAGGRRCGGPSRHTRWGLMVRMAGDSRRCRARPGLFGHRASASRPRRPAASSPAWAAPRSSLFYPGSWNEGISSGQGLMAVALVIFARWSPLRCIWRGAAVRRRRAPSARRCSRSASR